MITLSVHVIRARQWYKYGRQSWALGTAGILYRDCFRRNRRTRSEREEVGGHSRLTSVNIRVSMF